MTATNWRMKGHYMKNCNCIATCPCDTVGLPYPAGEGCFGMSGMAILEGHFGDVPLGGLKWAVTYRWPGPLHEGNGEVQPFVDASANAEQRDALLQILSGQAGNAWFEVLASIVTTVHEPQFVPIELTFDKKKRNARMTIPGALETVSAPLTVPATGDEQEVHVQMPSGMEYKEYAVAQAAVLKGTGAIQFDLEGTHSSLAVVEHTHEGLVA